MPNFDKHFKMNSDDAIEYIRCRLPGFFDSQNLVCSEIGDGNINYIFRVQTEAGSRSLIIKQADKFTRSSGNPADTDRNRIEAEILQIQRSIAPEQVPEVYLYDPVMSCIVMQDIGDHENMRYAMLNRRIFPGFSADISDFMANTLIRSSDIIMNPEEKKRNVGKFINPAMCDISERLVFTEPYTNALNSNKPFTANLEFLTQEIYDDDRLRLEAAKLKNTFRTKAQSLIHGDLHSGSIFVKEDSTMVLDPEFAFYGPAGYDVGNVIAHLVFAWVNAALTEENKEIRQRFLEWNQKTIADIIDQFKEKSIIIIGNNCAEPLMAGERFPEWFLADILQDIAGYTGMELIRRVIGAAKVRDITDIKDSEKRVTAERICVLTAKDCILNRENRFRCGQDYVDALLKAAKSCKIQIL